MINEELDQELDEAGDGFSDEETRESDSDKQSEKLQDSVKYHQSRADKLYAEKQKLEKQYTEELAKMRQELDNLKTKTLPEEKEPVMPQLPTDMYDVEQTTKYYLEMAKYQRDLMEWNSKQFEKRIEPLKQTQLKVQEEEKAKQIRKSMIEEAKLAGADDAEAEGLVDFLTKDIVSYEAPDYLKLYRLSKQGVPPPKKFETEAGIAERGGAEPREKSGQIKRQSDWATKFRT